MTNVPSSTINPIAPESRRLFLSSYSKTNLFSKYAERTLSLILRDNLSQGVIFKGYDNEFGNLQKVLKQKNYLKL